MLLSGWKYYLDASCVRGDDATAPLDFQLAEEKDTPACHLTKFSYTWFRGDRVPAVLATPDDAPGPFPCVVFVHDNDNGNDKNFMAKLGLDEPFVGAGFAFVCFDQAMRGERKLSSKSGSSAAGAFRVRAARTGNDPRRPHPLRPWPLRLDESRSPKRIS